MSDYKYFNDGLLKGGNVPNTDNICLCDRGVMIYNYDNTKKQQLSGDVYINVKSDLIKNIYINNITKNKYKNAKKTP